MSILLNTNERSSFEQAIQDHWDTFSSFHRIVVVKEPKQILIDDNISIYAGYDNNSNRDNVRFVSDTGIFNAILFNNNTKSEDPTIKAIDTQVQNVDKIIKVEEDAKNFIDEGQTERIIIDDIETFVQKCPGIAKSYGNKVFYYFALQKTS